MLKSPPPWRLSKLRLGPALHDPVVAPPVGDQVGDRRHLEAVALGELDQVRRRAMVPSSFMISQITPAGISPASRAISTAASV